MTAVSQRWRAHRSLYRPAGEVIDPSRYEVEPIDRPTARAFIEAHHYEPTFPPNRWRFGLFTRSRLVGVAMFTVPVGKTVLTGTLGITDPRDGAYLGRFVLLDEVPGNGETWFLGRVYELLRSEGLAGAVSDSDPEPRTAVDGRVVMPGHVGTIYQAFNGRYVGRASSRTLRLLPDGTIFSERAMSKIRGRERGWRYAVEQLVAAGSPAPETLGEDLRGWMWRALKIVSRPLKHPGNHRYVWPLHRAVAKRLPAGLPYPKIRRAAS